MDEPVAHGSIEHHFIRKLSAFDISWRGRHRAHRVVLQGSADLFAPPFPLIARGNFRSVVHYHGVRQIFADGEVFYPGHCPKWGADFRDRNLSWIRPVAVPDGIGLSKSVQTQGP